MEECLLMNCKERERLKIIIRLEEKTLTRHLAAKQLNISGRQLRRLLQMYRKYGEKGLISRRRGQKSNNKLPQALQDQALHLIRTHYPDFGPTLAHEKLTEVHSLQLSLSALRNLMIKHKLWEPKRWKPARVHQCRLPRECRGELIQMDGSYHDWFEGRRPKCCLLVVVDDATSSLLHLEFVEWESSFGYFGVLKKYIKTYGLPLSIYTDRLAVFETTRKTEKHYKDTQFHRATKELGIELILALSAPAKGRVERTNGVLQDRLVKEMRLQRISTLEEANAFLPSFLASYNKKFAKKPRNPIDAHRSLSDDLNLDWILCLHHERKVSDDLMISWRGCRYQIVAKKCRHRLAGKKIKVLEKEDKSIELFYEGDSLSFINFSEEPAVLSEPTEAALLKNWKQPHYIYTPPPEHPWRRCPPIFREMVQK